MSPWECFMSIPACGWVAKNGFHQLGHDLGNATLHSGNECGSLQCYGEPQILVVEFLLEVEETGIDCPCFPLCPAQDIAWDDLITINNEIPWLCWA